MTNLESIKTDHFKQRTQFVVMTLEGHCLDSCDTLFPARQIKGSLFDEILFLESIKNILGEPEHFKQIPLYFPCVHTMIGNAKSYFDFEFSYYKKSRILWIISDFYQHYHALIPLQQERNERAIESEVLRLKQKNLQLEKCILEMQHQELQRIEKAKTTFFAQVSHEMRTPLQNILGLTDMLKQNDDSQQADIIKGLTTTTRHLVSIINDVLDYSKMESHELKLRNLPFRVRETVEGTTRAFQHICREKDISLRVIIEGEVPEGISGDEVRFAQVLYNLLGNAVKFTNQGAVVIHIWVADQKDEEVILSGDVTDTGIGIPQEALEKVFLPFEQAAAKHYKGTGLGLSMVKKILSMQNGKVSITSKVGEGTSVSFSLPFTIVKLDEERDQPSASEDYVLKNIRRVLVGEDDPMTGKLLSHWLQEMGLEVDLEKTGQGVLKQWHSQEYDLLIMDDFMPELRGTEVLMQISQGERDTPVILLSGSQVDQQLSKEALLGVHYIMMKPLEPVLLKQHIMALDQCLGQSAVDLKYLTSISDGQPWLMLDLLNTFIQTVPLELAQMQRFIDEKEMNFLHRSIHKIKANFDYVGGTGIKSFIAGFERDVLRNEHTKTYHQRTNHLYSVTKIMIRRLKILKSSLTEG